MLNGMQYSEIKALLEEKKNVLITTHKSPDGDAIGSSLGLYHLLVANGNSVKVAVPNEYPEFLHWMEGHTSILDFEVKESKVKNAFDTAEVLFCLDYNAPHRAGKLEDLIKEFKGPIIMIDHHPQPDDFATYTYSETSGSSTAELIYEFACGLKWETKITATIGECLYSGMVTDTGSFRFPATTARTHRIVADLMDKGLRPFLIHQRIYDSNTESRLKLLGYSLSEKMKVFPEYKTAYISLSQDEMKRFGYQSGDTEGVVNYALSIKGVRFAAIFKEYDQHIRISFRSQGDFSVNDFARANFEGGGHVNAAGGTSYDSLQATVDRFESLLPKYQEALNAE